MKCAWKRFNFLMLVAVVAVWAFGSGAGVSEAAKYKLVVGSGGGNIGAPIHVAKMKGYFAQEDLVIEHKIFSSGAAMVEALAAGGVELGHSGDLPFVSLAAANVPACIIAQNGQDKDYLEIFVGKDLGMTKPTDFYGKKIGLRFASAAHILWINFLEKYSLDAKKIRVVNLAPNDLRAAFKNKDVDGGVVWYPHLTTAAQVRPTHFAHSQLLNKFSGMAKPANIHLSFTLISARKEALKNKQGAMRAYMRAMLKSYRFMNDSGNRAEFLNILGKAYKMSAPAMKPILDNTFYRLEITDEMVNAEQAVAVNMKRVGRKLKRTPNMKEFVYTDLLKSVAKDLAKTEGACKL